MIQQIILPKFNNKLEEQLINLFHSSDLPLHFNKTGSKEFTNYQRVSIIILFRKSGKSIRAFIDVKTQIVLDFNFITYREHDVKGAEKIFKRNKIKGVFGLGDKGYGSENLH